MAKTETRFRPESEEEMMLFENLFGITGKAHRDGVDKETIIQALTAVASNVAGHEPEDDEEPGGFEAPEPEIDAREVHCGSCGQVREIDRALMGGQAVLTCGHHVELSDAKAQELIDDG